MAHALSIIPSRLLEYTGWGIAFNRSTRLRLARNFGQRTARSTYMWHKQQRAHVVASQLQYRTPASATRRLDERLTTSARASLHRNEPANFYRASRIAAAQPSSFLAPHSYRHRTSAEPLVSRRPESHPLFAAKFTQSARRNAPVLQLDVLLPRRRARLALDRWIQCSRLCPARPPSAGSGGLRWTRRHAAVSPPFVSAVEVARQKTGSRVQLR